jgi:hypothetical protein
LGQRPIGRCAGLTVASLTWAASDDVAGLATVEFRSELPLRKRRYALAFMRDTLRIKRLLDRLATDPDGGLMWYELTAHPIANRYSTASAWRSQEHLRRFAADPVHVEVMRRQRSRLGPAKFETRVRDTE